MRISERIIKAVREAAVFNPDVQVAPKCVLWTDGDRQWEPVIARLRAEMSELFVLGDYAPEDRTGPGIWLRCVIANKIEGIEVPSGSTPVLYLPGVSRQDLRAVENCPEHLKPLAELQYSGTIWSQVNSKDWTILAFLKSDQLGLGLDVAQDKGAKIGMQHAIARLLDEDVAYLKDKHLDRDYFNTLLTSGDPIRDLLRWLDQGDEATRTGDENVWRAFVEVCKSKFEFDPEKDGVLKGAELLANHARPWKAVWERYCEAPKRYPNIPKRIRQCQPPVVDLFPDIDAIGGWPQWNDGQEQDLRDKLSKLEQLNPSQARSRCKELAKQHSGRKELVWVELGESPLASAVEHLGTLAEITTESLNAGAISDLAVKYSDSGWRADDAMLRALACVCEKLDYEAVANAIRSIYTPWAEDSARYFQELVFNKGYPGQIDPTGSSSDEECILFVDGLRLDVARRLMDLLTDRGLSVKASENWAAIPTVTATGKPAVAPVRELISGSDMNADFEPCVTATGKSLKGGYYLPKLLASEGWQVLPKNQDDNIEPRAWCEFGDIDHVGHDRGWKLARHLDSMLQEIADKIERLLTNSRRRVRVVTDHGWLLLPGGLPKSQLPASLSDNTWGRCAALKPGANTEERLYPWSWNSHQEFSMANGISCYRSGLEYAHGGLSLQECLTLQLVVSVDGARRGAVAITDITWAGLRCRTTVEGNYAGLSLDIRREPGNLGSSLTVGNKPFKEDGTCSVLVGDEGVEGEEAVLVIIDERGNLVAQYNTVVGTEDE